MTVSSILLNIGVFLAAFVLWAGVGFADEEKTVAPAVPLVDGDLQKKLRSTYLFYRQSILQKDLNEWSRTMARFRQVEVRNEIISKGRNFPSALFEGAISPPDVSNLKLMDARIRNNTANMIYFGQVNMGETDGEIPQNVLILYFVFEPRIGWRFDNMRLLNLASLPKIRAELSAGRKDSLKGPDFDPKVGVPEIPRACPVPDYLGRVDIAANGYAVTLVVNGFEYPVVANTGRRMLVTGGFRRGVNKLSLKIKEIEVPKGEKRILQMAAYASNKVRGSKAAQVLLWTPEDIPRDYKTEIVVNDDVVAGK